MQSACLFNQNRDNFFLKLAHQTSKQHSSIYSESSLKYLHYFFNLIRSDFPHFKSNFKKRVSILFQ